MATYVYKNPYVLIDSTQFTAAVTSLELTVSADAPEDTAMGDTFRSRIPGGLKDWSISMTCNQDHTTSSPGIDVFLWGWLGTTATVLFRPTTETSGATNPTYSGIAILTDYTPLSGSVGDAAQTNANWVGKGTLARGTV